EGAIADLSLALKNDPKYVSAYDNRYLALLRLGRNDEAKKDKESYVQLQPGQEANLKAIEDNLVPIYRRNPTPKTPQEYLTRGNALLSAGYNRQAAHDYQRAFELDEFNADALYNLGTTLKNNGYPESAAIVWKKCLDVDDRYVSALFELGEYERNTLNRSAE